MEKGQIIELEIIDMSSEGSGIAKTDGLVLFVENCVLGDRINARITRIKKNFANAETVEVIEASPLRNDGFCKYIHECGGCPLGNLKYEEQLKLKEKWVRDKITRIGGISEPKMNPIIGMSDPDRYRNKATFAVSGEGAVGFVKRKTHDVVHLIDCKLLNHKIMGISNALSEYMELEFVRNNISKLIVRDAPGTDEMMAVITANNPNMPNIQRLAGMLNEGSGFSLESLKINDRTIAGKSVITDIAGELNFEISADSFYQVNPVQMIKLYEKAMEYADLRGSETVLDLYCGVGTIGLFAAKRMNNTGRVIGIESVKQAVIDANRNSVINGIVNTWYITGKAEDVLPGIMGSKPYLGYNEVNELVEKEPPVRIEHADVVFLDPPRAGCEEELLNAVVMAGPDRIVYVSCDPATLARDIKYLISKGYEFIEATPVDMFPHTGHVETVVLLSRNV